MRFTNMSDFGANSTLMRQSRSVQQLLLVSRQAALSCLYVLNLSRKSRACCGAAARCASFVEHRRCRCQRVLLRAQPRTRWEERVGELDCGMRWRWCKFGVLWCESEKTW